MESAVPPSYDEAVTRDHWSIVARYIHGPDLCEALLVSKRWHQIFAPHLWGNPASHFGTENDRVYGRQRREREGRRTESILTMISRPYTLQTGSPDSSYQSPGAHSYLALASSTIGDIRGAQE